MSTKLSLQEALARQAEGPDARPVSSVFHMPNVCIAPVHIQHPVSLAKAIMTLGIGLTAAHQALNRLADRETIAMAIPRDLATITAALEPHGVTVTPYADADAPPSATSR